MTDIDARLSRGYAESRSAQEREERRERDLAATFRPDAGMERLLANPALADRLGPEHRTALAYYSAAKTAHQKQGA